MNDPTPPEIPHTSNRAITILRIVLWFLPAIIFPVCFVVLASLVYGQNLQSPLWLLIPFVPTLCVIYALGLFDQKLRCQQQGIPYRNRDPGRIPWALTFLLFQFLVAPVLAVTVAFGFCAVMGFA